MKSTFYALLMTALVFAGCDKPTGAPGSDAARKFDLNFNA